MSLKALAQQIFDRFDKQIVEACQGANVPPAFIAGLIANEAGKRNGVIVREATRFEPHVYASLIAVRDGRQAKYNRITRQDLTGASDAAIRALSISYEATQIMGWHVVKNLRCTIADLRNPDKHFFYTVKLLEMNGFVRNATEDQMDGEMRQWNTGREGGQTYHANYVPNARRIRELYRELERGRVSRGIAARVGEPEDVTFADLGEDEIRLEIPTAAAAGQPAGGGDHTPTEDAPGTTQPSEQTSTDQPPPFTAEDKPFTAEDKTVDAPPKEGSTKQAATVTLLGFAVPTFAAGAVTAMKSAVSDGYISAQQVGDVVLSFIQNNTKYVFAGLGLLVGGMMLKKLYRQITLWLSMYFAARSDMHNVTAKPQ